MRRKRLTYAMVGGARGSFIGPIHRMALRLDNLAELAAGCFSRDPVVNKSSAAKFSLDESRVYPDWRSLVAAEAGKVDFLVICTTNETHYEIAKAALEAGMDVFCEKPLSLSLEEAESLSRIARRRNRILGVPFTYTGYPMVKLARDLVRKGELGKIDKVVMEYLQGSFRKTDPKRSRAWKMDPKKAGPSCVVSDIGVHAFTIIEYVTGLETKSLLADLTSYSTGSVLEDDASILMRLAPAAGLPGSRKICTKASLVVSKVATGEENGVRLRVYGEKASLFWDQEAPDRLTVRYPFRPDAVYKRKAPYIEADSQSSMKASRIPAGHPEGFIEALANIYSEFVAAVVSRRACDFPGPREGVRSMRFVEAALKSFRDGSAWTAL
ncbi:MAG: Gfo/Idh/MocA family oxidoreductase [Kiritimatiellae bacterium]|nr:Gfo/Idh/MocA family oxidoreductase [Kiritimatiellia bacterium]